MTTSRRPVVGPPAAKASPRFTGEGTFLRLPSAESVPDYDIAVLGVPFDGGTSYRPGARFGPMAIRQASRHLRPAFHPDLDIAPLETLQVVDAGDVPCTPFSIDEALAQITAHAGDHIGNAQGVVALGGDHTITLGMLRAVHRAHGPVAIVHFDAHLDTWDSYFGADRTHGTVLRRAFEEGLLIPDRSIHIGTRGPLYGPQDLVDDAGFGFKIVRAGEFDVLGTDTVADRIHDRVGDSPVYLSIDIDVLDPAFAPGTGTPESGGLTARELLHVIRRLGADAIVGADVVEVAPAYDHAEITALAAATVVYDLLALRAQRA